MIELAKLASQGRAHSSARPWTNEENDFLYVLINERGLARPTAAEWVRNGIMSLTDYDKAVKAKFEPKKLDDVLKDAVEGLKDSAKKVVKGKKSV